MNRCNAGRKQTIRLVRIILKRANKARLHYLIPAAQKTSTDATDTPRTEAASKGVVQKSPQSSRAAKHLHNLQLRVMPPSVDFVALIPEKLTLLETPRRWVLQPLKSPRVLAGTHTDATLHRHIISKSFQLCMYLFLEGKAHFREYLGQDLEPHNISFPPRSPTL